MTSREREQQRAGGTVFTGTMFSHTAPEAPARKAPPMPRPEGTCYVSGDAAAVSIPDADQSIYTPGPPPLQPDLQVDDQSRFTTTQQTFAEPTGQAANLHNLPLEPGDTLQHGKYMIVATIGQGSFGITYNAIDTVLERTIIIKEHFPSALAGRNSTESTVHPKISHEHGKDTYTWSLNRFYSEAKNLAKVHHSNVVKIDVFFKENNTAYFVMPHVPGNSLAQEMQEKEYHEEELLSLLTRLLNGLECIHKKKILHLDIKPGNIIISDEGEPILIDFGASQTGEARERIWSQGYAPPEQVTPGREKEIGPQSDLYALGATFYHIITGEKPQEHPIPLCQRYAGSDTCPYSEAFLESIDKAMMTAPARRWKSAKAWRRKLQAIMLENEIEEQNWNLRSAICACLTRYFLLRGRACRSEFNYFFLAVSLLFFTLHAIQGIMPESEWENYNQMSLIILIFVVIPLATAAIRRLHDINQSGVWVLLLPLLLPVLCLKKSRSGSCRYGSAPLPPV